MRRPSPVIHNHNVPFLRQSWCWTAGLQPTAGEVHIDTEPSRQPAYAQTHYERTRPNGQGFKCLIMTSFWWRFSRGHRTVRWLAQHKHKTTTSEMDLLHSAYKHLVLPPNYQGKRIVRYKLCPKMC
jgi:hypothetical protein